VEFNPATGALLGYFPQALTHLSHIAAAVALQQMSWWSPPTLPRSCAPGRATGAPGSGSTSSRSGPRSSGAGSAGTCGPRGAPRHRRGGAGAHPPGDGARPGGAARPARLAGCPRQLPLAAPSNGQRAEEPSCRPCCAGGKRAVARRLPATRPPDSQVCGGRSAPVRHGRGSRAMRRPLWTLSHPGLGTTRLVAGNRVPGQRGRCRPAGAGPGIAWPAARTRLRITQTSTSCTIRTAG
jgi:hypothetical protein